MENEAQSAANPTDNIDQLLARINGLASDGGGNPVRSTTGSELPAPDRSVASSAPLRSETPSALVASLLRDDANRNVDAHGDFFPREPRSLAASKVTGTLLEEIVSKYLVAKGEASIRAISEQVKMPFQIVEECVIRLKSEQLLSYID
ncbi:MAG: hypothetical protein P8J27_07400, partial [Mariniblastus sp.]|nr:hypothetical protein [Mariniblastus sp.]